MTQKALLQAAGDGTTTPSGYVGEVISSTGTANVLNTGYTNLTSITLTPGAWEVSAMLYINSAATADVMSFGIATISGGGTGNGWTPSVNQGYMRWAASIGAISNTVNASRYVVTSGTTTLWFTASTGTGTFNTTGTLRAVRVG